MEKTSFNKEVYKGILIFGLVNKYLLEKFKKHIDSEDFKNYPKNPHQVREYMGIIYYGYIPEGGEQVTHFTVILRGETYSTTSTQSMKNRIKRLLKAGYSQSLE